MLLAVLLAPCPAALAALNGPDPHHCCHTGEDDAPQAPAAADCQTMCAREQAEKAVVLAPLADLGDFELTPVLAGDLLTPWAHPAPEPYAAPPPGPADIRLLTCTFLI